MDSRLRMAEYAAAVAELRSSIIDLKNHIEAKKKDPIVSRKLQQYLTTAVKSVEEFRPQNEDDLGYVEIIPTLAEARSILKKADLITPVIPNDTQTKQLNSSPDWRMFQVPKVQLESFTGDITKYPQFIATFDAMYASLPITNLQRMIYLQSHLTGAASTKIQHLKPTEDSYEVARELLDKTYNRKNKLVMALYSQLNAMPPANKEPRSLRKTHDQIENILTNLKANQQNIDENPHLKIQILSKFPKSLLKKLCTEENPSLEDIRRTIENYVSISEHVESCTQQTENIVGTPLELITKKATMGALVTAQKRDEKIRTFHSPLQNNPSRINPYCVYCKEKHFSDQCSKYSSLTERRAQLGAGCYNCLRSGHTKKDCRSTKPCWHCKQFKKHHSSLCPTKYGQPAQEKQQPINDHQIPAKINTTKETKTNLFAQRSRGTYLITVLEVCSQAGETTSKCRVVLDSGANQTYITNRAVDYLELPVIGKKKIDIEVFGGAVMKNITTASTHFIVKMKDGSEILLEAETTPEIAKNIESYDKDEFLKLYPQYNGLQFAEDKTEMPIDLLIGNDYLWEILRPTEVIPVHSNAQLIKTQLGHFIVGKLMKDTRMNTTNLFTLQQAAEALWKLDAIGIIDEDIDRKGEEEMALNKFYENISFDKTCKRYEVRFPFRMEPPLIENNFALALGRLRSMYNKYKDKTEVLQTYNEIIEQQLQSGIIEEVKEKADSTLIHYLPHHPVIAPDKSTKLRIVYDASAKTKKSTLSLNETMHKGRNLLEDMVSLLLRFRKHKVAVVADVQRAFHQIKLQKEHRNYTRFLWLTSLEKGPELSNLKTFRFAVVPFGVAASPFLLAATIRFHLKNKKNTLAEKLLEDIYVDNIVSGTEDAEAAERFYKETLEIFEECSMNLRLWNTNSSPFKQQIDESKRDESTVVSVLGLRWCTLSDTLSVFPIAGDWPTGPCTPRMVLKTSARFFDPLGIWLPVSLKPKIFLQKLRKKGCTWDSVLTDQDIVEWKEMYENLNKAACHQIPRKMKTTNMNTDQIQLHIFTDASIKAYAAVAYIRIQEKIKDIKVTQIMAKGRIAPMGKQLTIPKLELLGVYIGARMTEFLRKSLNYEEIHTHFWSDSKCVLAWIHTEKILPIFIENRVKSIRNLKNVTYRYIESNENIADLPSRTATYEETVNSSWFIGPEILYRNSDSWPQKYELNVTDKIKTHINDNEKIESLLLTVQNEAWEIIDRFTSLKKLLAITKWCMKFYAATAVAKRKNVWQIETSWARTTILRWWVAKEQQRCFPEIYEKIKKGKLCKQMKIWSVTCDNKGLLRIIGRMRYQPIEYEKKYLVLLPPPARSKLTKLIILNEHEVVHHAGTNGTLTQLRRVFWLPRGRHCVYHIIKTCRKCKRYTSRPYRQPNLAEYPDFRLRKGSCFEYVGIDQAGPLTIRNRKYYLLLYTCLVTRGVMLELLADMTSDELTHAFRRIVARKGAPCYVISDRATQFTTAESFKHVIEDEITWKFIPPHASWAGGAYERMISLTKQALHRTFHHTGLSENQLRTALYEVENSLNSRPLTYVYDGSNENAPLTPNDLLGIRMTNYAEPQEPTCFETNVRKRLIDNWSKATRLLNEFWKIWQNDYLTYLRERNEKYRFRGNALNRQPRVGEVVIIREPLLKRNKWHLGRIEKLHGSHDGEVRSADVRTWSRGLVISIHRPVQDLYPLEVNDEPPEIENTQSNGESQSGNGEDGHLSESRESQRRSSDEFSLAEVELEVHEDSNNAELPHIDQVVEIEDDTFDW